VVSSGIVDCNNIITRKRNSHSQAKTQGKGKYARDALALERAIRKDTGPIIPHSLSHTLKDFIHSHLKEKKIIVRGKRKEKVTVRTELRDKEKKILFL